MKRIGYIIMILAFCSCSGQPNKNKNLNSRETNYEYSSPDSQQIATTKLLNNGLIAEAKGLWLSSVLPDSIIVHKKILPWMDLFYGNLLLSINDSDTISISGNMDIGQLKFTVIDTQTFILPEWNNFRFTYSKEKDAIFIGSDQSYKTYRRLTDEEMLKIIRDEEALMNYVIHLLFKDEYMSKEEISRIKYISLGLETYNLFDFDAIGIEDKTGELQYYGWSFNTDTLSLFKTTFEYDDDSGFRQYKKGELDRQYIKNN